MAFYHIKTKIQTPVKSYVIQPLPQPHHSLPLSLYWLHLPSCTLNRPSLLLLLKGFATCAVSSDQYILPPNHRKVPHFTRFSIQRLPPLMNETKTLSSSAITIVPCAALVFLSIFQCFIFFSLLDRGVHYFPKHFLINQHIQLSIR